LVGELKIKELVFVWLGIGALAGAFLRYKLVSSTIVIGTLPVNILIIRKCGTLIWRFYFRKNINLDNIEVMMILS
jgi:fluoride ion exporter CrcB/FEX